VDDLEKSILQAAQKILPTLTPDQLRQRLARRNTATLKRPPRAWCLALRAADTRINDDNATLEPPPDASDPPTRYPTHTVTIEAPLLRRLIQPVRLEPGLAAREVAAVLGHSTTSLHYPRFKNCFQTHYIPGPRGTRIPLLYTDQPLDPNAKLYAAPDPLWSWTATYLGSRIPDDLAVTLTRVARIRPRGPSYRDTTALHPEHPELDPPPRKYQSRRLPPPPPDYVWYKWKGDVYMGYDWRNPYSKANYERAQRKKELARLARKKRNAKRPSTSTGSLQFEGWRWQCPACNRRVRTLYYPLPPLTFLDPDFLGRVASATLNGLQKDLPPPNIPTFACHTCHRVRHLSRIDRNTWNSLIAYLTAGLLYGREVPKPRWFHPTRKIAYHPQPTRQAPRRQQVLRRILNGWSIQQIARDLHTGIRAVHNHLRALCKQENVKDRHALTKKLNAPHPQPQNQYDRTKARRHQVLTLLLQGQSYKQIMSALALDFSTLNRDTQALYRAHNVKGYGQQARRSLAQKLGQTLPPTQADRTREEIHRRRQAGQSLKQIAHEMHLNYWAVDYHVKALRKQPRAPTKDALAAPTTS
jgi:DNA-binding NarL/FixJ family response regulator